MCIIALRIINILFAYGYLRMFYAPRSSLPPLDLDQGTKEDKGVRCQQ